MIKSRNLFLFSSGVPYLSRSEAYCQSEHLLSTTSSLARTTSSCNIAASSNHEIIYPCAPLRQSCIEVAPFRDSSVNPTQRTLRRNISDLGAEHRLNIGPSFPEALLRRERSCTAAVLGGRRIDFRCFPSPRRGPKSPLGIMLADIQTGIREGTHSSSLRTGTASLPVTTSPPPECPFSNIGD